MPFSATCAGSNKPSLPAGQGRAPTAWAVLSKFMRNLPQATHLTVSRQPVRCSPGHPGEGSLRPPFPPSVLPIRRCTSKGMRISRATPGHLTPPPTGPAQVQQAVRRKCVCRILTDHKPRRIIKRADMLLSKVLYGSRVTGDMCTLQRMMQAGPRKPYIRIGIH